MHLFAELTLVIDIIDNSPRLAELPVTFLSEENNVSTNAIFLHFATSFCFLLGEGVGGLGEW